MKEAIEQIDVTDKTKTLGRPKKQKVLELHQVRAFHLWRIAQEFPEGIRQDLTNRYMIAYVQKLGKTSHPLAGKSERIVDCWYKRITRTIGFKRQNMVGN